MPRRAGRNARILIDLAGGGEAVPVSFQNTWSIDSATDKIEVTSFGDGTKTYVAGLPDAKGSLAGFWDSVGNDLFAASQDGLARKFYLYPDFQNDPLHYYYNTSFFDFSPSSDVSGAVKVASNFAAASTMYRHTA